MRDTISQFDLVPSARGKRFHAHSGRHVLIIGGGASGVLMAAQLLRQPEAGFRVTLVERSALLGCGLAYATDDPGHLLNTRVAQMSAYPEDPRHFQRWLRRNGIAAEGDSFVVRRVYGHYLESLLTPWRDSGAGEARLRCVRGDCRHLVEMPDGVRAELADGRTLLAAAAVLATGHAVPTKPPLPLRGGWDFRPPPDPEARVAIVGTGLGMVDHVVTLLAAGHRGPIRCLSRHGLLPHSHAPGTPLEVEERDIPLGASVARTLRWLRALTRQAEAMGGTWRDAIDGIRPHVAAIWQAWPAVERARFLRHAAAYWEVHRHRMPPASAHLIDEARARGQVSILRGRFEQARQARISFGISFRARGAARPQRLAADHVIDCRGIRRNPAEHAAPVVRGLLAEGAARLDGLALGLDTTASARLIDRAGRPSARLHAIGPAARGALWEITAIPDILSQTQRLAQRLTEELPEASCGNLPPPKAPQARAH